MTQRVVANRYVVVRELGRGGMGVVWLAEDRTIGRRVAVKELHLQDGVGDDERRVLQERVLREARAAGRLNDPAVVTVFDVVQEAGTTYIVMELIDAPTLADLVADHGPLPQDQVARMAEQVLSALETAHAAGIVHRDVKPGNIMLLPSGRVKLTDFGIAQSTDDSRLTTSGILVGSPAYLAPERIRGADADAGSDLWALAAVLFFAVEGRPAFERASAAATMHAILNEVPYLKRCQGPLASVIMGLLNAVPEARPTADQARALLARAGGSTPPGGLAATTALPGTARMPGFRPPGTAPQRAPSASGGRRAVVAVLVAAVAAGLFLGGFFTRGALLADPDDGRPTRMDATITYGDGGTLPELSWSTSPEGACLNGRLVSGQRITESAQVDCAEPHDLQIFHSLTQLESPEDYERFPDTGYPGRDALTAVAEPVCAMVFDSARVDGDKAELSYRAVVPAERAWSENRWTACVLYRTDGDQMTDTYLASK